MQIELQEKLLELVQNEFQEVKDEPYRIMEIGSKYAKRQNFQQASKLFDEKFHKEQPMWLITNNVNYFEERLQVQLETTPNVPQIVQDNNVLPTTNQDASGSFVLVKKRISKKPENLRKKQLYHIQPLHNLVELNPLSYLPKSIQDEKQETNKEIANEEIVNLINEKIKIKKRVNKRRKSIKKKEEKNGFC